MADAQPEQPDVSTIRENPLEQIEVMGPHDLDPQTRAPDLNTASSEQVALVAFIGDKLAQTIVDQRERRGGFRSWPDAATVRGVDGKGVAELQRAMRPSPPSD